MWCLWLGKFSYQTSTQSLFTGHIGLFQRESGLDQVELVVSYGKRRKKNSYFYFDPSHDTSRTLIHPRIQSSLPQKYVIK